jgi:hypothetical protein
MSEAAKQVALQQLMQTCASFRAVPQTESSSALMDVWLDYITALLNRGTYFVISLTYVLS